MFQLLSRIGIESLGSTPRLFNLLPFKEVVFVTIVIRLVLTLVGTLQVYVSWKRRR
jgi:hypothetical protein